MITPKPAEPPPRTQTDSRPVESGEQWLVRNATDKRRLWERLNPRHRKQLRVVARALALRQTQARLPEPVRAKLATLLDELERLATRIEKLLVAMATRTPPAE